MRKIEFEQGSEEWLAWRRTLLTATDAPMLMGASPYVTPYQGWQRKLGLIEEQKSNAAMERGTRNEPIARDLFIAEYNINMTPRVIHSESHNFLGASLDGISDCGKYLLEIKCNGDKYHSSLFRYGIPEFHMMQMQHQLLCTDGTAEMCFYYSFNNGNHICFEVLPDIMWMNEYLEKAREYWKRVLFFDPPPLSCKDYRDIDSIEWYEKASEYTDIDQQIKAMERRKEEIRRKLIELCGEDSCKGSGIKVLKKQTKGRIDYESIQEIANLDLEKYRKPMNESWTITIDRR